MQKLCSLVLFSVIALGMAVYVVRGPSYHGHTPLLLSHGLPSTISEDKRPPTTPDVNWNNHYVGTR